MCNLPLKFTRTLLHITLLGALGHLIPVHVELDFARIGWDYLAVITHPDVGSRLVIHASSIR